MPCFLIGTASFSEVRGSRSQRKGNGVISEKSPQKSPELCLSLHHFGPQVFGRQRSSFHLLAAVAACSLIWLMILLTLVTHVTEANHVENMDISVYILLDSVCVCINICNTWVDIHETIDNGLLDWSELWQGKKQIQKSRRQVFDLASWRMRQQST